MSFYQQGPRNVSTLSVDSYLGTLGSTNDDQSFVRFIQNVYTINGETLGYARKVESHYAKIREKAQALGMKGAYTQEQLRDQAAYHVYDDQLTTLQWEANELKEKSKKAKKSPDASSVERKHVDAMQAIDKYFEAGIKSAQGRLDFMYKYPGVYSGEGHTSHVKAVQHCIEHAKQAHKKMMGEMRRAEGRLCQAFGLLSLDDE
ncbi:hypothetical protein GGR57DRAFT_519037 [Xylariaceae sp. FL1272]|nr:hypothetical protein GGR57DRAFT_519037 [Xylariaceae sp. FL1272]